MTTSNRLALLGLLLAALATPLALGALQQGPQQRLAVPTAVAAVAVVPTAEPSATPYYTPTWPPALRPSPGPTATLWIMPERPTPNVWRWRPPAVMLAERMTEREAVEWLRSVGQ